MASVSLLKLVVYAFCLYLAYAIGEELSESEAPVEVACCFASSALVLESMYVAIAL